MHTSKFIAIALLAVAAFVLSCVSPFYGTARIEPGFHVYAGLAATSYIAQLAPHYPYCIGGRGDIALQYGFNKYIQLYGQGALGLGFSIREGTGEYPDGYPGGKPIGIIDWNVGVQGALPFKHIAPAVSVGVSQFLGDLALQASLMIGIGQEEKLTLGTRLWLDGFLDLVPAWVDAFVGFHPKPRWSVFGGYRFTMPGYELSHPIATLGVGYKLK